MDRIIRIFRHHRESITYIFWGGATTIANYVIYFSCTHILNTGYITGNLIAWVFAVLFAYATNKKFVFRTPWISISNVIRELLGFISGRVASFIIETVILYLFIGVMKLNDNVVKVFSNVIVMIINYIYSKQFIFRS